MKKFKKQKGITLVALIITIVVLLILAVVAIGVVQDSNIIGHAQNAAVRYNQAKGNEENEITNIEALLKEFGTKTIAYGKKYVLVGNSDIYIIFSEDGTATGTVTSGTKINYKLNGSTIQACMNGTEYIDMGVFNEEFTRFETIGDEESDGGQVFELDNAEPIVIDEEYLLYCMETSDGTQAAFVNTVTNEGTMFLVDGDMFVLVPLLGIHIRDTFEYEGRDHYNVITATPSFGNNQEEQYYGEIINNDLDLKLVDNGETLVLKSQKLPIESKNIVEIYEATSDETDFSGTGMTLTGYMKSYGLLENGECYHLYKVYGHYFIISNGTVDYTKENGILKVEQIDKNFAGTGEFKKYTIGTDVIKVK